MSALLQSLVAVVVTVLLVRSVLPAWRERALALRVWRAVRPRHVLGSVALLALVVGTTFALLWLVPVTGYGLGTLVGFDGNAVFAPLEAVDRGTGGSGLLAPTPTPGTPGPDWRLLGLAAPFLALLLALFPYLAHREELAFRHGLEDASLVRQAWVALRFGLVHLVMLVPLAAALGIAAAGFAYGRAYLHTYHGAAARTTDLEGSSGLAVLSAPPRAQLRADAVLAATTWHATFNSVVVLVVLAALTAGSL